MKLKYKVIPLRHGVYRIYWKAGGPSSVASVGSDSKGNQWFAPSNWLFLGKVGPASRDWEGVLKVDLIETQ